MSFVSIDFVIFMPIVFCIYWALSKNVKIQNLFLLAASYFFYAWWNWRYLSLILICSLTNYYAGLLMLKYDSQKIRKIILYACFAVCLGILGVFKYYNFFITSFVEAFSLFGANLPAKTLYIILPIGISFYTFHTLTYTIEIYRRKFEPTKDVISFFLFVSIFPLAMAGPIERATNLLPQIYKRRTFDNAQATDGMRQILWGILKKIVIADNCATYVNQVFQNPSTQSGSTLLLGLIFFTIQVYCDFSGYSDMAIGIGKLLGFKFLQNFNYPLFAVSFADFWKRNHISMTQWFMDYVYYPMTNNKTKLWQWNLCMIATFLLSGLWHGAGWTFVIWGLYQGVFIVISLNSQKRRKRFEKKHNLKDNMPYKFFRMLMTIGIVCIGAVFFRASSIGQAFEYLRNMVNMSLFSIPIIKNGLPLLLISITFFLIIEWLQKNREHGLSKMPSNLVLRWLIYVLFCVVIYKFGVFNYSQFIYFQF
ncbi:MAG: MBOAT family protein [Paludibacter sp.]|nr:MBOAT family protein [Paludibacter sp.]